MSQAACSAQQGIYYVANTHDMWHDWSQIAPGVILGTGLFAIYGLGLGALLKNQIVAIVVGLDIHPGRRDDRRADMADDRRIPSRVRLPRRSRTPPGRASGAAPPSSFLGGEGRACC